VGYERVKEIENPELASARARDLYQTKSYSQAWIWSRPATAYFSPSWTAFQADRGRDFSVIVDGISN
jgi:hypothetical protein